MFVISRWRKTLNWISRLVRRISRWSLRARALAWASNFMTRDHTTLDKTWRGFYDRYLTRSDYSRVGQKSK